MLSARERRRIPVLIAGKRHDGAGDAEIHNEPERLLERQAESKNRKIRDRQPADQA